MAVHPFLGWSGVSPVVVPVPAYGGLTSKELLPSPLHLTTRLLSSLQIHGRQEWEESLSGTERRNAHCGMATVTVVPGAGECVVNQGCASFQPVPVLQQPDGELCDLQQYC